MASRGSTALWIISIVLVGAGDLEIDSLDELLLGPTGLAFADGDPVGAAKVLKDLTVVSTGTREEKLAAFSLAAESLKIQ